MKLGKRLLLLAAFIFLYQLSFSQEHCGTVQYEEQRKRKNPKSETREEFERWLQDKINTRPFEAQRTGEKQAAYTIPVVVHVIHNGEPIGTGTNISVAQIQSQIEVLNKDFNRLNTDATNTPAEFLPFAGNIDIEFVLAKQDPIGAPTNGIVRVQGTQTSWTRNNDTLIKSLSYWPAENYLNIWVIKFSDSSIGYAQFPVSSLPGLDDSPNDRLTDGVVISYTAFGSIDYGSFALNSKYNKGRTATHEIGHFLGLRHIWGDDGSACTGTDYVEDTPNQGGSYLNQCPTTTRTSCGSNDMYMNYMDYTNDACMNIFTMGQVGRFNVVLQNSPRRLSLLSSKGANEPGPIPIDAAIRSIVNPGSSACGGPLIPSIEIQNLGTSILNTVRVQLKVNNNVVETKDFALNLNNLQSSVIDFSSVTPTSASLKFTFEIVQANGVTDGNITNNLQEITTSIPVQVSLPISEIFNSIPSSWKVTNPDNLKTWQTVSTSTNGNSMFVNSFDYDNQGAIDQLITPVIDLTNEQVVFLKFDRAHAPYSDNEYSERLRVLVSTSCDFSSSPLVVFDLSGAALATAPASGNYFSPTADQWKTEFISLSQFVGQKIQIAFESTNGYGNNQYLDNVVVLSEQFIDLAIESLQSPSPVTCNSTITPTLLLRNNGTTSVTSVSIRISSNNQTPVTQQLSNLTLTPGAEQTVTLNAITLQPGSNSVSFTLLNPNGFIDSNSNNDLLTSKIVVNDARDVIPYRENFNSTFQQQWSIVSQGNELTWNNSITNYKTSLLYNSFNYSKLGEESWLVSPVFDFSGYSKASVFFDVSYAYRFVENEGLKVLYSEDCGNTFNTVLYDKSGEPLSVTISNASWIPSLKTHWRKDFIDLTSLVGKDNLRFAFVANTNNGNNLYLDNIEFFIDNDPDPVFLNNSFSVYGPANDVKLTFNLVERQPVALQIYNSIGQLMLNNTLPETLNQTYDFDLQHFAPGVYIFRVLIGEEASAVRVVLSR